MISPTTPAVLARFDGLCAAIQAKGRGVTLSQLGDAHALPRELERKDPDPERVTFLRERLGLDPQEVEA